ncbi:MAG: neutral/alkaline non-lysosomal ceramidase N-terminal domain-containing protein, partial [Verrucomicrobiae bacterium]|nr:neutral/alkaline non-lysosomal ceramidase N-terminal domain-containing protein [Verrucomicrobiae bacterium]
GYANYIHDELWAKALVLGNEKMKLAIVVLDTCLLDQDFCDHVKRMIKINAGIEPENVIVSATHTHSGGAICGAHLCEPDMEYRLWLPTRISDAVVLAVSNMVPAVIGWASTNVDEHVFCRRLTIKPGMVYTNQLGETNDIAKMNWDSPHPVDDKACGPVDPEFFVVALKTPQGRPIAVLANYSLHYVGGVPGGHISADYFGAYAEKLKRAVDVDDGRAEFVAIFSNGTSGDINNINPKERKNLKPYEQINRVAEDLVEKTVYMLYSMNYRTNVDLRVVVAEVEVKTRKPTPEEVEAAKAFLGDRPSYVLRTWRDNYAREQVLLSKYPDTVKVPVQVFKIGDLAIAAWAGEIFAESGLELKQKSPIKPLINIGLANGYSGYIPPPEQFKYGAYETWRMRTSFLETNAIPGLIDAYLNLLGKLK